ncbi:hypothetical protein ACFX2F_015883 [Malus domestica]
MLVSCTAEKDDSDFHQQEKEGEMEHEEAAETIITGEQLNYAKEIELLHNLVRELQHRNLRIEGKLLRAREEGSCGRCEAVWFGEEAARGGQENDS